MKIYASVEMVAEVSEEEFKAIKAKCISHVINNHPYYEEYWDDDIGKLFSERGNIRSDGNNYISDQMWEEWASRFFPQ